MEGIAVAISEYGFPIVATVGLLYVIHFIWNFITNNIKARWRVGSWVATPTGQ